MLSKCSLLCFFLFILNIQIFFSYLCYFFVPHSDFPLCYFALVLCHCEADSFLILFLPINLLEMCLWKSGNSCNSFRANVWLYGNCAVYFCIKFNWKFQKHIRLNILTFFLMLLTLSQLFPTHNIV